MRIQRVKAGRKKGTGMKCRFCGFRTQTKTPDGRHIHERDQLQKLRLHIQFMHRDRAVAVFRETAVYAEEMRQKLREIEGPL